MLRLLSRVGGGGTIPPASEGGGRGPRGLRAGGGAGGEGSRRGLPAPPPGWQPAVPCPGPPLVVGALPPGVRVWFRGGMGGGPWTAPPGAPSDLNPPSALSEWAMVMGGSGGARPPYCSGAPPCAAPRLGPRAALARWCGLARRPRPPREQAAWGAGARGVQVEPHPPPPPASRSLLGEGGRPLGCGGAEGRFCGSQAGGGSGGGGLGRPPHRPPSPRPVGRRPAICFLRCDPPGYTRAVGVAGRPRASGAARLAADWSVRRGGGEGGGTPPPWFAPLSSPVQLLKGPLCLRRPGRRRSAVGRQRAGRGAGGSRGALAPAAVPPHPGCSGLFGGGCGAAVFSVCLRPLSGLRGRGGGMGRALWSPGAGP